MEYRHEKNLIALYDESGERLARVEFPAVGENIVEVTHTVVDESVRGRGIAGQLMKELVKELREDGRKAELSCSYAVRWFEKHPECSDVLQE